MVNSKFHPTGGAQLCKTLLLHPIMTILSPRILKWIDSLWTSSSWALFFKATKSLVLAATALNLPRPPSVCRLGFWGAAWARRWSRYWARSSASEEGQDPSRVREDRGEKSRWEVCRLFRRSRLFFLPVCFKEFVKLIFCFLPNA